jgi:hypothetical protein
MVIPLLEPLALSGCGFGAPPLLRPFQGRVYTVGMEIVRYGRKITGVVEGAKPRVGPWGVYGEAIGDPKFSIISSSKDSEFLQAADEFIATHEDALRELAKR